jgi:ABC-2 type transport system permease protein
MEGSAMPAEPGRKALIILAAKARAAGNSIRNRSVFRTLPVLVLGILFGAAIYMGTKRALLFMMSLEPMGLVLSARFVSLVFFSLMGFLFLSNLINAISSFYLSADIRLLRANPVPVGDILIAKAAVTVIEASWMALLFVPLMLAAMGAAWSAPPVYYALSPLLFSLFILIPAGAGMTLAHLLTWLFPAKRLRDAILLLGLGLLVFVYYAIKSSAPGVMDDPLGMMDVIIPLRAASPFSPHYWMANAILPLLAGAVPDLLYPMLILSNAAFLLVMAHYVGIALYPGGLDRLRTGVAPPVWARTACPRPGRAMLFKDARLFARDTGQWSQLLIMLALGFIYVYNFRSLPIGQISAYVPYVREAVVLVNVLMAGLVMAAVSARFVFTSVSLEGRAFWVVRSSPMQMRRFLRGKFLFGLVPVALLTVVLVVMGNMAVGASGLLQIASAVMVLILSVSICGLGTGMGAIYPRFRYENIASVSVGLGAVAFMLVALCVVTVTAALAAWPAYIYIRTTEPPWAIICVSTACILALNAASFHFPMRAGLRRLEVMDASLES